MRRTLYYILFTTLLGVTLVSCKKDDKIAAVQGFTVEVSYPDDYSSTVAAGVTVTLTNAVTSEQVSAVTAGDGKAVFNDLLPGNYQVFATQTLSADLAAELTGYSAELYLNATLANELINSASVLKIQLQGSSVGGLVFKQVFYACSKSSAGVNILRDQFYEIYNNSTDVIYLDSLMLGDPHGSPGNTSSATPSGFSTDKENVYLRNIWMIPGDGKTYPLEPGESIVIAQTAQDHTTSNDGSINLGKGVADFETYVESSGRDIDNPDVTNMIPVWIPSAGFYYQTYVFGASVVIFRHPDPSAIEKVTEPGSSSNSTFARIPLAAIIDGADFLANAAGVSFKRLPAAIDAGFNYTSGSYSGESMMRKVKSTAVNGRKILQDTNNSSQDFEVIKPALPKGWKKVEEE